MTRTIIIKTKDEKDFELIKGLADRLGLSVKEEHEQDLLEKQKAAFKNLAGSWVGDETGDEIAARIHNARNDAPRDVQL